jgi:hypothetical protein
MTRIELEIKKSGERLDYYEKEIDYARYRGDWKDFNR